jgi:dnd system-associated protein 4
MADIRIKVAKDKAKLVKSLRAGDGSTGPFQTYYEIIAFAAALGISRKKSIPFSEQNSSKEIDPIRQEQFASKGYDQLINLIAISHSQNPGILSNLEESEEKKIALFESYANGGLHIIDEAIRGSENIAGQVLLILSQERGKNLSLDNHDFLDLDFL